MEKNLYYENLRAAVDLLFLDNTINGSTPIEEVIDIIEDRFNLGATFNTVITEQDIYNVTEPTSQDMALDYAHMYSTLDLNYGYEDYT